MNPTNPKVLLTIDVEDWFQVENFKAWVPFSSWGSRQLRVERNIHRILDMLDTVVCGCPTTSTGSTNPIDHSRPPSSPRATFFVLGWIAERLPGLVREIVGRGHEIASHGYCHDLCPALAECDLKEDLARSKGILEDLAGCSVTGYRAPGFSISDTVLLALEEAGYRYDSSYNSFERNNRHGKPRLCTDCGNGSGCLRISDDLYELPIGNLTISDYNLPWGGGGYFRLIPLPIFRAGVRRILARRRVYVFYFHPWEIDPEQPRVQEASALSKFRHYVNLSRTESKLVSFIHAFKDHGFATCADYLSKIRKR